jgi:hypothetical protein
MRACTVCGHPERPEIDAALIAGDAYRDIARQYGVSKDALARHLLAHLGPQTAEVNRAKQRDILAEVERMLARLDRALERAEASGDDRLLLLALRENRPTLELLAKLRGELDERPVVNIVATQEWIILRSALLSATEGYPDVRAKVVEAIKRHTEIAS